MHAEFCAILRYLAGVAYAYRRIVTEYLSQRRSADCDRL